jgi:hypothetical protein
MWHTNLCNFNVFRPTAVTQWRESLHVFEHIIDYPRGHMTAVEAPDWWIPLHDEPGRNRWENEFVSLKFVDAVVSWECMDAVSKRSLNSVFKYYIVYAIL